MNVRIEVTGDGEDPRWVEASGALDSGSVCLGILAIAGDHSPLPWIEAWNTAAPGTPLLGTVLRAFSDGTRVFQNGAVLITLTSENTSCQSALVESQDHTPSRAASDLFRLLRRRRGQANRRYPKRAIIALSSGETFVPQGLPDQLIIEGGAGFDLIGASYRPTQGVVFTEEGASDQGIAAVELLLQEGIYFGEGCHGLIGSEVIRAGALDRSLEIVSTYPRATFEDDREPHAHFVSPKENSRLQLASPPEIHGFTFTREFPKPAGPLIEPSHLDSEETNFVYFETPDPFFVSEHSFRSPHSIPSTTCVFP